MPLSDGALVTAAGPKQPQKWYEQRLKEAAFHHSGMKRLFP